MNISGTDVHSVVSFYHDYLPTPDARPPERVRKRVAESSCGLFGSESLEAIGKPLPPSNHMIRSTRRRYSRLSEHCAITSL